MKKTKDKSDDLVAFNTRVHRPIKETVKESSKLAGVNMEDIAHDAWRFYFGINDEMLDHRRKFGQSNDFASYWVSKNGRRTCCVTPRSPT